jgi:hypothetical protein
MKSESAMQRLGKVLAEIGWNPEQTDSGGFHIDFGPPHLPVSTGFAAIIGDTKQLIIYLNFGFLVISEKRDEVLRLVARINWDLIIGNFELDSQDGHLRFKSSFDFEGAELDECLIRNALLGAMRAVETYGGALMKAALP